VLSPALPAGRPAFRAKFTKEAAAGNKRVTFSPKAAHAYDSVTALLKAYEAAASPKKGAPLLTALAKVNFTGEETPRYALPRPKGPQLGTLHGSSEMFRKSTWEFESTQQSIEDGQKAIL